MEEAKPTPTRRERVRLCDPEPVQDGERDVQQPAEPEVNPKAGANGKDDLPPRYNLPRDYRDIPDDKYDGETMFPYVNIEDAPAEDAAVIRHVRKINASYRRSVEAVVETGRLLLEAKAALRHGQWSKVLEYLPFGERQAQMLMKIAAHPTLSNPQYIADLPASWATLYELANLPATEVENLIADKVINPKMKRLQAKKASQVPLAYNVMGLVRSVYLFTTYTTPQEFVESQNFLMRYQIRRDWLEQATRWLHDVLRIVDESAPTWDEMQAQFEAQKQRLAEEAFGPEYAASLIEDEESDDDPDPVDPEYAASLIEDEESDDDPDPDEKVS